jgi:hypothetical protein
VTWSSARPGLSGIAGKLLLSPDGGCGDNPFRWCDNLSNNDSAEFTFMSKAFADTVVRMAFDTKVMSASNNLASQPRLPIFSETSRRFVIR